MTTGVLATVIVLALALAPAFAGTWKHEVVPNDGDVLTYSADGKIQFYLGCGRGFALHVKYPGEAKQEGEADIAIATSKGPTAARRKWRRSARSRRASIRRPSRRN